MAKAIDNEAAQLSTVTLTKGKEKIVVNESDAADWKKAGWKPEAAQADAGSGSDGQ